MIKSKKYAYSCSDPKIPAEIQRMANKKYNGNQSKMTVDLLVQGMEAERQKPKVDSK